MIDLTPYLLTGFNQLPKTSVTIGGSTIDCVFNTSTHNDQKVYGGFEPDMEATIAIQTSLLTNPKSLKGTTVTIEGESWRVLTVRYGVAITHLTLISTEKT